MGASFGNSRWLWEAHACCAGQCPSHSVPEPGRDTALGGAQRSGSNCEPSEGSRGRARGLPEEGPCPQARSPATPDLPRVHPPLAWGSFHRRPDGTLYLGKEAPQSPAHITIGVRVRAPPPPSRPSPARPGSPVSSQDGPLPCAPGPMSPSYSPPHLGLTAPRRRVSHRSLRDSRTADGSLLTLRDLRRLNYSRTEKAFSKIRQHTDSSTRRNC